MKGMTNLRFASPPFSEKKATQVAGLILAIYGEPIEYEKLVKLMYNINREALGRRGRPVVYDVSYSFKEGLILSETLDLAKEVSSDKGRYWRKHIKRNGYLVRLRAKSDDGELSDNEVELITEVAERYRKVSIFDMRAEHHQKFSEYKDPETEGAIRIKNELVDILDALGFNEDDVVAIASEVQEDAYIMAYLNA